MFARILLILMIAGVLLGLAYLLQAPVPIDPVEWTPPNPPRLTGLYRPNQRLAAIQRLGEGMGVGPEDVAVDRQGRIYGGVEDGRIVRLAPDGSGAEDFATTGGRPLGLDFDGAGNLIVADAFRGLLSISPDGQATVLTTEEGGVPFRLTNDVDVAADGTIYFSDTSRKFPLDMYWAELLEHRPNGRLLAYDPASGDTRLVLDSLYFANGVAVSPDQQSVMVVETGKYRVRRVWVAGERAGTSEVVIENLPGFPDGISSNGRNGFWLALIAPRNAELDQSLLQSRFMRRLIWRLPESFLPVPGEYGFILRLDARGSVADAPQDPRARYRQISSVEQVGGSLYFGSLVEAAVGRMPVP
jgi:sugar lactone lactonase YvrE